MLFPWPAIVLLVLLYKPLRDVFSAVGSALIDSIQTPRSLKVAGVELTLDPAVAREVAVKSAAVVERDYERHAEAAVRTWGVWKKFVAIIEDLVQPVAHGPFRATMHIEDSLQPEMLYQLVDYFFVAESARGTHTRGRRNSIRFGIIGRAWRLGQSLYDAEVSRTQPNSSKCGE